MSVPPQGAAISELECPSCHNTFATAQRCWLNLTTGQLHPLHLWRDASLALLAVAVLAGIIALNAHQLLTLLAVAAIWIVLLCLPYHVRRVHRAPKVLDCRCTLCGYEWRQSPEGAAP